MTEFVISINSSLISLSRYTQLRGGQVRNALRECSSSPGLCKAQGRAMRKQRAASPARFTGLTPDPHIGEDAPHPKRS